MKPVLAAVLVLAVSGACASRTGDAAGADSDGIYQLGTFNGLLAGALEGTVSYADLATRGDFGTGTFDGLDGEMWAMEGYFYRIRADGTAVRVDPALTAPFVTLKRFRADLETAISGPMPCADLYKVLDTKLPALNVPYAVRISGKFESVRTRSVARKTKPYPSAEEIIRSQVEKEWTGVGGDMVGFRFPAYLAGTQMPGYHLHFLNSDRTLGGHVLDCRISEVSAAFDRASELQVAYPRPGGEFDRVELAPKGR